MPRLTCRIIAIAATLVLLLAGCSEQDSPSTSVAAAGTTEAASTLPPPSETAPDALTDRIEQIQQQVTAWMDATELEVAQEAAEGARNLVVGPDGPGYGDTTGDGTITGQAEIGLLPGLTGEAGIAQDAESTQCVQRDVLGGSWENPQERWRILEDAIASWSTTNNPFPTLPSHPQRVVGWATLTLEAAELTQATEFAGHAQLHVNVSRRAVDC